MSRAPVTTAGDVRETASPEETERLGETLAGSLAAGDVLLLLGPLGAGKTCLVAGLARGLGCQGRVRSPSFTLVNEYSGRVPLFHLDLYRLEGPEAEDLGLEERLERGVLAVEWGERLPAHLREQALSLRFEIRSGTVVVLPLERRASGELEIELERGVQLGVAHRGRRLRAPVTGGAVGVILDARDDPIQLPNRPGDARTVIQSWRDALRREGRGSAG